MNNEYPTAREASGHVFRYGVWLGLAAMAVFGILWATGTIFHVATKPVDLAVGVIDRVIDPDHALQTYRWFHEANQQIKVKEGNITLAKQALEASREDRQEARRVELLGLQQGCQRLVGEYNAKAMRADTVIFQHPEKFLPGDWPGDREPLPQSVNLSICN